MPLVLLSQTKNANHFWELSEKHNQNGNRDSAIIVLQDAIAVFNNASEIPELASSYNNLGVRYQTYGKWDEAALTYTKGLLLLNEYEEYDSLKADLNLNLGLLYIKTQDQKTAYIYFDKAEQLALTCNNNRVLFIFYKVKGRFKEGIRFAKQIQNNQYLANYYYISRGNSPEVTKLYLDSAKMVMPKLPNALLQNFQYHATLVGFFLKEGEIDSALYHCKKSEEVAPLLNDDEVNHHYTYNYSQVYLAKKDFEKAYKFMSIADSLKKQYLHPHNRIALQELEKQKKLFETEKKIITLRQEKKIRNIIIITFFLLFVVVIYFIRKTAKLNRKLTESNKAKERLFSIISHDLRGVIASIKMLSQSKKIENLQKIEQGSTNLLLEFDTLFSWSAEHLDKIELHPKILDLNEMIEETIQLLKTQITEKKIKISKDFSDDWIAFADENTIRIVIRNILHNAIKYSPENSEIVIAIFNSENKTQIDIIDKGCGFGCNHQSKGLGLGLDLCKEFTTLNKGILLIDSSEKGSIVSVVLPNS
ncbi:MAG: tetratricopeptide repeat-containing sensor histidine kinase [Flavobacteriales bacterium]|nr:tetratricopeptide repeat-containing sensor histidine kinase [Flavobacteriales bacterium]